MENENVKKLLELVVENPDLPIVCMVESEIVCDDCYTRWLAQIGRCEIGEYASYNERFWDDREEFKEEYYDRNEEILCSHFGYDPSKSPCMRNHLRYSREELKANDEAEKRLDAYLEEVAERSFVKCIIVDIDLPDDIQFGEVHDEPIVYEEENADADN